MTDQPGAPRTEATPERAVHGPREGTHTALTVAVVLLALVVLVGAGVIGYAIGRPASTVHGTIAVTGSGTVQGRPDTVSFTVGVHTQAPSAVAALADNNQRVRSLEATLLRHGVAKQGMQTSGLNVFETTDSNGNLTGFAVDDTLDVTMHKIARAGAAIEAAAQAAGNGLQLNGISFSIANDSKLLAQARTKAIESAHTAASQVAAGAHAAVGAVEKIVDQESASSPVYFAPYAASFSLLRQGVPLQAGRQPIKVQVSVVYALDS